jgi:hypothetical protein
MFQGKSFLIITLLAGVNTCFAQYENQGTMEEKMPSSGTGERSEKIIYMGLVGGGENPNGPLRTETQVGIVAGAQYLSGVSYGAEVNTTKLDDVSRSQRTIATVQSGYKMGGDIPLLKDVYVAVGAGPAFVPDHVRWAIAPVVGFDIPLSKKMHEFVSIGLNAKYVGVTNSPDSYVGSAAVKYWY